MLRKLRNHLARYQPLASEQAATSLEYALLLAAIGLPSYWAIKAALAALVGHYQMMTTINALPFP
jgi:Flp pilus assembly pilin Flp